LTSLVFRFGHRTWNRGTEEKEKERETDGTKRVAHFLNMQNKVIVSCDFLSSSALATRKLTFHHLARKCHLAKTGCKNFVALCVQTLRAVAKKREREKAVIRQMSQYKFSSRLKLARH